MKQELSLALGTRRIVRSFLLIVPLLAPVVVRAQQPIAPQAQAMQQTIIKLTGETLDWQTQALTLQRQVDDLTKQLADAKKTQESPK